VAETSTGAPACGIQDLVLEQVRRRPEAPAVHESSSGQILTYRELWRRAGALAGLLAGHGVARGDLVAVALGRSADLVVALLGIVRAGAAYLPLDDRAPAGRTAAILAEAQARMVVCPKSGTADPVLPLGVRRLAVPTDAGAAGPPPAVANFRDDPVYVAYTSGSTGRPKGVVVPHRAVIRLVSGATYCPIRPGDRVANMSNPAFDATTFEIWSTLAVGGTVVVLPPVTDLTMDDWAQLVRAEQITIMFLTTSLFHMVAREAPAALRSLHTVVVGGEQLDLTAARRVLGAGPPGRLVNGYGPTETTTFAAYFVCTTESLAGREAVPIGFPLQQTRLHVLDEGLRPVSPGEVGELCIGGPGVALGYLHQPDLTAERFVPVPVATGETAGLMYRTGDLARQLPDGALLLLGRRDRQVKLRGFRIELEEIERAASATGLVDGVFVEKVGQGPFAWLAGLVLPAAGVPAGTLPDALTAALAERVPSYMVPSRWEVLAELPLGPTGKVDQAQLRARLRELSPAPGIAAEPAPGTAAEPAPGTAAEPVPPELARIWSEVLSVEPVDPAHNFFDLGGNSILAIQLASRIGERMAVPVEPADVMLAASLADLAARIRHPKPARDPHRDAPVGGAR
jgi:amino acid adenylation domain-containing protein